MTHPTARQVDRAFLLNVSNWPKASPNIPYCCLKKLEEHRFGYILGCPKPNEPIRVLLGNIFDTDTTLDEVHYADVDALLDAGWYVD